MKHSPILYVEDDATDVFMFQRAFAQTGLPNPVYVARDGVEGLDWLTGQGQHSNRQLYPAPKLMLVDLKLPRKTGLELLSELREQPAFRFLPVIVLSGCSYSTGIHSAFAHGANGYLIKSSEPADLIPWLIDLLAVCRSCNFSASGRLSFLGSQPLSHPDRPVMPFSDSRPFRGAYRPIAPARGELLFKLFAPK